MPKVSIDLIKNLQFCVQNMPGNIYFKDKDGHYLACSNYLIETSGLSSYRDIIGKTDFDIFSSKQAKRLRENDSQVMDTGDTVIVEEVITLPSGEKRYFEVVKVPFKDQQNKIIGIIGNSVDVTRRKKAEENTLLLEKEKSAIEAKRQVISDLAASIAHEIGNLLGGTTINMQLLGYKLKPKIIELIEKHSDKSREILELFDNLEKSMNSANLMFDSIKMNMRSGMINKSQLELADIAEDIETILTSCFLGEDIVANLKWNKEENFEYVGIPAYTRNILINLIKNALYFIKEEKKGEITITFEKGEKFNKLVFEDTARGIPIEILPKIFTRFSTTRKGGSGMGLAFCKMVMQEYGGDITCESELGKYTRFILTFPTVVFE